jgi:hypothetical protein
MIFTCGLRRSQGMLLNRKSHIPKPKPLSISPTPCSGRHHFVYIDLGHATTLSLIRLLAATACKVTLFLHLIFCSSRIWNYNKSRIHSYRGARFVEISLDDSFIFRGEIAKAPGILNGSEESAEGAVVRYALTAADAGSITVVVVVLAILIAIAHSLCSHPLHHERLYSLSHRRQVSPPPPLHSKYKTMVA